MLAAVVFCRRSQRQRPSGTYEHDNERGQFLVARGVHSGTSMHGTTLPSRSARACGGVGGRRQVLPGRGRAFDVSVASVVKARNATEPRVTCGGQANGRQPALCACWRTRLAAGASDPEAGPDAARFAGRAAPAWRYRCLRYAMAFSAAGRDQLQRKTCSPQSRIGLMSPDGGTGGCGIKSASILPIWCSSTRPGTRTLGLPIISGPRRRKARQRPAR